MAQMSSERFWNFNVAQMSSERYQTKNAASSKIYVFLPRIYFYLDVLKALLINIHSELFYKSRPFTTTQIKVYYKKSRLYTDERY